MNIELNNNTIDIDYNFIEYGYPPYPQGRWSNHVPHYHISVNGINFDFYGSINDARMGKYFLSDDDLVYAFDCILNDALTFFNGYKEFFMEFGFDEANYNTWERLKDNQQLYEALAAEVNDGKSDLCDLINSLHEKYEGLF